MYPDCSCGPIAFWLGQCQEYLKFPDCSLLQISRTQIADDTLQPSYSAGRQENLKFPDSSCLLTGPAASKISSTQIAVATLLLSYWTCHQTKNPSTQIAVAPCSPLTGPAASTKTQASVRGHTTTCEALSHASKERSVQDLFTLLRVKPKLLGLTPKKSQVVRLQLLLCSPLAGPAATKTSSTQSAVAILQLSYWACHQTI